MTTKIESIIAGIAAIIVLFSSILGAKFSVMIASLTLIAFSAYLYFKDKKEFANQLEKIIITTVISVLIAAGIIANLRYFAGEDDWICDNGQWVMHGQPDSPMPTEACPQK